MRFIIRTHIIMVDKWYRNEKFLIALRSIVNDRGFSVSPMARSAVETARCLVEWCSDPNNVQLLTDFTATLFKRLKDCLPKKRTSKYKEKIWGAFHAERCSTEYTSLWSTFLMNSIHQDAHPIFFQHLTDLLYRVVIKEEYPIIERDTAASSDTTR